MPRGVGERKLRALFQIENDIRKWSMEKFAKVAGWSSESIEAVLRTIPAAIEWKTKSFPGAAASASASRPLGASASASASAVPTKFVVFTGVRDSVLEDTLKRDGWGIEPSITKKTQLLITADDAKETGKVKKAAASGIRIMTISAFKAHK
jgi:NAD-dependent DNA ligase